MKKIWKTANGEILKKGQREFKLLEGGKESSTEYNQLLSTIDKIKSGKLVIKEEILKKVG